MKSIIFSIVILFSVLISYSQDTSNIDLKKIFTQIERETLPFSTKNVNIKKTKLIEKHTLFNSLLKNDTNKYYYTVRVFDNDLRKNVTRNRHYYYRAVAKVDLKHIKLFIYRKGGRGEGKFILATCTNSNYIIDTLKIGYKKGGGNVEISEYTEGRIKRDLSIETKQISWNPKYSDEKNNEEDDIPKSVVKISHYKIDDKTGKISYLKSKKKYSKCYPEQFTYDDTECEIFSSDSIQNPD